MLTLEPPTCGVEAIWEATMSPYYFPTVLVADEIDLFTHLHTAPATAAEVAHAFQMSPRAAEAMLGVLASTGHLVRYAGRFHVTESSRWFLLPTSPYYCGAALAARRKRPIDHIVLKEMLFPQKADTRESGPMLLDTDMWKASESHGNRLQESTALMHALFLPAAVSMAAQSDFTGVVKLLDVAGGSGCFSIALASRYPHMRLTVLDLPAVCRLTVEYVRQYGAEGRIETFPAEMFGDEWPTGHDAHFFSNVFHDWSAAQCRLLAAKSFAMLPSGGRIYVHESLLNDTRDGPPLMSLYSMNMARVTEAGKQYSAEELTATLAATGFVDLRVAHSYSIFSLVTARKP